MGLILFRKEDQEICVDENTIMAEVLTNDNTWEYIGEFKESASDDLDDQEEDLERETEIGRIYRHTIQFTVDARITLTTDVKTERFKDVPVDIYDY